MKFSFSILPFLNCQKQVLIIHFGTTLSFVSLHSFSLSSSLGLIMRKENEMLKEKVRTK